MKTTDQNDPSAAQCAAQIRRSVSQLSRRLRPRMHADGISTAKLSVLGHVRRHASITPTELAAHEGVKIQTLTRLLAELEADGWLARTPHPLDGRQSLLSMTALGNKRLVAAFQASDAAFAELIQARLGADERDLLLRACALLDELDEALGVQ